MRVCWLVFTLLLLGCEAPLNLKAVEQERGRLLHRYDQLQAVADNGVVTVVVGAGGTVLVSGDRGEVWQRHQLEGRPLLIDVAACPDGTLGALGPRHRLWVSTDQGRGWREREIKSAEVSLALTCDHHNRFWAVGGFSTIWMSSDRGKNWQENSLGDDTQLTTVQFVDGDYGFITGEFGTVLVTRDGGVTWDRAQDLPNEFYPQASLFLDRNRGWIAGLNGRILQTGDSGTSWVSQSTASDASIFGLAAQGGRLFAVGDHGTLWRLDQDSWKAVEHGGPAVSYLRAIQPVGDGNLLLAGGRGSLFKVSTAEIEGAIGH